MFDEYGVRMFDNYVSEFGSKNMRTIGEFGTKNFTFISHTLNDIGEMIDGVEYSVNSIKLIEEDGVFNDTGNIDKELILVETVSFVDELFARKLFFIVADIELHELYLVEVDLEKIEDSDMRIIENHLVDFTLRK